MLNIISFATILLSLATASNAHRDIVSTTANGSGVVAGLATYSTGFNARVFSYRAGDLIDFNNNNYVANSYALGYPLTSTNQVTEPNFTYDFPDKGEELYSMLNINMWNTLIELKGYFKPPQSGLYQVSINEVNDGGFIWLGQGAFDGCSQEMTDGSYNDVLIALRGTGAHSSYVYLEEGILYPMRTTFINIFFDASFQFEIVQPNGDIITNFKDTIINFEKSDIQACIAAPYGHNPIQTSTKYNYGTQYTTISTTYQQGVIDNTSYLLKQVYFPQPTETIQSTITNTFVASTTLTSIQTSNGVETPVIIEIKQESVDETQLISSSTTAAANIVTVTATGRTMSEASGCSMNDALMKKLPGFHASLYKYNECFGFLEKTYYANDYTTEYLIGTSNNITAPNFSVDACLFKSDVIFGNSIDSWKGYVAQLTGYIYASESGLYEFTTNYSDDGSMVWIGTSDAFACCQPDEIPYNSDKGALFFAKDHQKVTGFVHLTQGYYYPIRIVLVNWFGDSTLDVSMVTPSGILVKDDWSNWVVSIEDEQEGFCA